MPTLVLSRRYSEDSNALWSAAQSAGWSVQRLLGYEAPEGLAAREPVLYSETLLADAVSASLGLAMLEPDAAWLPSLPARYLRRAVTLRTLGEVRALAERRFVKPIDEKLFPARVYEPGERVEPAGAFAEDTPVLSAEPVRFGLEVRAFVCEREVRALSAYVRDGALAQRADGSWPLAREEETQARAFLAELLGDEGVALPPAVVVDVGVALGRGWCVVEANPAWASGLCGCAPSAVLPVLRRASAPLASLTEQERRWERAAHLALA